MGALSWDYLTPSWSSQNHRVGLHSTSEKGVRDLWSDQVIYRTWGYPISNRWRGQVVNCTGSPHEWSMSQCDPGDSVYADANRSVTSQGREPVRCTRTNTWTNIKWQHIIICFSFFNQMVAIGNSKRQYDRTVTFYLSCTIRGYRNWKISPDFSL